MKTWAFCIAKMDKVKRIRGRALQRMREAHFRHNPLCVMCLEQGRITAAVQLDHILALHLDGTETADNRQGLCADCHTEKSKLERGHTYKQKLTIGIDGWPIKR